MGAEDDLAGGELAGGVRVFVGGVCRMGIYRWVFGRVWGVGGKIVMHVGG